MRKYWRIIAITFVIIVSIGTFYIQSTISANKLPQFSIEKISGNEQEIESLVLSTEYTERNSASSEYMDLSLKGSLYDRQQSFFERISESNYGTPKRASLIKNHRSFLRGKWWSGLLFEDEQSIVHVDISYSYNDVMNNKFIISILDKKTNKKTSFDDTINLGEKNNGWLEILKVQVFDNHLKVITKNDYYKNEQEYYDFELFTFDIGKQKLVSNETILSAASGQESDEDSRLRFDLLDETGIEGNHLLALIKVENTLTFVEDEEYYVEDVREQTLITYDMASDKMEEIDIYEMRDYGEPQFYDDKHIYFTDVDPEKGINIHTFSLADGKITDTFNIEYPENSGGLFLEMNDGKIYVLNTSKNLQDKAYITVLDFGSKEILYQGEIVAKDLKENFDLSIYSIGFQ